jgi:cellulose biosynthesis protein BcsQ
LAAAAACDGLVVTTLDTDGQGTLARWHRRRAEIEGVARIEGKTIAIAHAARIASSTGLMLVDTPTAVEAFPEAIHALIEVADMVLIPCQPLPDDVESVLGAMASVISHKRPGLFVINRVKTGVKELEVARARLGRYGDVAAISLPDSVAIVRAMGSGYGPTEVSGRGTEEAGALWAEIKRRCAL